LGPAQVRGVPPVVATAVAEWIPAYSEKLL
jgi:hypothetical protein